MRTASAGEREPIGKSASSSVMGLVSSMQLIDGAFDSRGTANVRAIIPSGSNSVSAVSFAGRSNFKFVAEAKLNGAVVTNTLIDMAATSSIVPISTLALLGFKACVRSFVDAHVEVFGICGDTAYVYGYIDVPVVIGGIENRHPLVVVAELVFRS